MSAMGRSLPLLAAWALGVAAIAWSGTAVDGYKLHVMRVPLPHPYPTDGVIMFVVFTTVESVILGLIVRPWSYHRSWGRALLAFLLGAVLILGFGVLLMHAPTFAFIHWAWLATVVLGLFGLFVGTLVRIAARRH